MLTFEIFGRARNNSKKFLKLCQTSFSVFINSYVLYVKEVREKNSRILRLSKLFVGKLRSIFLKIKLTKHKIQMEKTTLHGVTSGSK